MIGARDKHRRLPLPAASTPAKAEHWLDRYERERECLDEELAKRLAVDGTDGECGRPRGQGDVGR